MFWTIFVPVLLMWALVGAVSLGGFLRKVRSEHWAAAGTITIGLGLLTLAETLAR